MKKEFLELKTLKTAMIALSEGLTVLVLEKVDSLYANSRHAMCARYGLGNGAESKNVIFCRVTTCNCGNC